MFYIYEIKYINNYNRLTNLLIVKLHFCYRYFLITFTYNMYRTLKTTQEYESYTLKRFYFYFNIYIFQNSLLFFEFCGFY